MELLIATTIFLFGFFIGFATGKSKGQKKRNNDLDRWYISVMSKPKDV